MQIVDVEKEYFVDHNETTNMFTVCKFVKIHNMNVSLQSEVCRFRDIDEAIKYKNKLNEEYEDMEKEYNG